MICGPTDLFYDDDGDVGEDKDEDADVDVDDDIATKYVGIASETKRIVDKNVRNAWEWQLEDIFSGKRKLEFDTKQNQIKQNNTRIVINTNKWRNRNEHLKWRETVIDRLTHLSLSVSVSVAPSHRLKATNFNWITPTNKLLM